MGKVMYIFCGPNGSGKTSITSRLIIDLFKEDFLYINPDEISKQLERDGVEESKLAKEAQLLAHRLTNQCIEEGRPFVVESVFSHISRLEMLKQAKQNGFEVNVIFILTRDPKINVERVKQRVLRGGHPVPEDKVISRYYRSINFLPQIREVCDTLLIYDNTDYIPQEDIEGTGKSPFYIYDSEGEEIIESGYESYVYQLFNSGIE